MSKGHGNNDPGCPEQGNVTNRDWVGTKRARGRNERADVARRVESRGVFSAQTRNYRNAKIAVPTMSYGSRVSFGGIEDQRDARFSRTARSVTLSEIVPLTRYTLADSGSPIA